VTARSRTWPVRLAAAAEDDFQDVLRWTAEHFGDRQARVYARTLSMAFEALAAGPRSSAQKRAMT
jgi:toxin ParE1/3/4